MVLADSTHLIKRVPNIDEPGVQRCWTEPDQIWRPVVDGDARADEGACDRLRVGMAQ